MASDGSAFLDPSNRDPAEWTLPAPPAELAMQAVTLTRLAGSVAHEVKNPLNAMALQVALLGDKIASASEALAAGCASNLASIKNQIGRINDVVRRYVELADPQPSSGFDAGALLADVTNLFGHEARRRRIALACEAGAGSVRASGDAARAARLLLGLMWRAVSDAPAGATLAVRASPAGDHVALAIEHPPAAGDASQGWIARVVTEGAAAMGGRLEESLRDGVVRTALVLPKEVLP